MVERNILIDQIVRKSLETEYEIKDFLGKGSNGEVYAVVRKKDQKDLAAKMITMSQDHINEC